MQAENLTTLYKGSVKNLLGDPNLNHLYFEFSDAYSIFDWGQMPDFIPDKGKSLLHTAANIFEFLQDRKTWRNWNIPQDLEKNINSLICLRELRANGLRTHYLEVKDDLLKVEKVDVFVPEWINNQWVYHNYDNRPVNCLLPLEVVFRHGVPKGSSLPKRVLSNQDYAHEIGLLEQVKEGDKFKNPIIEYSTKLETIDRYLTKAQAKKISQLNELEFAYLDALVEILSLRLKDFFTEIGIELWDGKFEFALIETANSRGFMLVDCIGPDELRLNYKNLMLSKEVLRQLYSDTEWFAAMQKAKTSGAHNWKDNCTIIPQKLARENIEMVADIYRYIANEVALKVKGKKLFDKDINLEQYLQ